MLTLQTLNSSILSLIVLAVMYISAYNRFENIFASYTLFMSLLTFNMVLIVVDILGWVFNALPGAINMLGNIGFNALLYLLVPIGPMLWLLYADFQVFHDAARLRKLKLPLVLLWMVHAAAVLLTLWTGWFFTVDMANIYHRGEYFWVHTAFCHLLVLYSFVFILRHRHLLERKYFTSLLLYYVPLSIGTLLQTVFYGVSFNWSGMMVSLLVIYFNIQDRSLHTDYLTGAYNRRQLDRYMRAKIEGSRGGKLFSAVLLDVNYFKEINDVYGHISGDEALRDIVRVIKNCISPSDFIARYGGDEFVVVVAGQVDVLEQTVACIRERIADFNRQGQRPYTLSLSMGYDVYEPAAQLSLDDFFKHLDQQMYQEKLALRANGEVHGAKK